MRAGLPTYLSLVIRTAWRHSFHAAHSAILALIIAAGLVTYFVPQVEVLVDLHGWQVATFVLSSIVVIRLLLAPYWIWIDDQNRLALLNDQLADKARETQRLAEKTAAIDEIANEISWAVNNLGNPQPHPASTSEPEVAIAAFRSRFDAWCDRVSKKLGNRDLFTQGDQAHFDSLGVIPFKQMWGHAKLDWIFSELALKLDRLREVEHRARERK